MKIARIEGAKKPVWLLQSWWTSYSTAEQGQLRGLPKHSKKTSDRAWQEWSLQSKPEAHETLATEILQHSSEENSGCRTQKPATVSSQAKKNMCGLEVATEIIELALKPREKMCNNIKRSSKKSLQVFLLEYLLPRAPKGIANVFISNSLI